MPNSVKGVKKATKNYLDKYSIVKTEGT